MFDVTEQVGLGWGGAGMFTFLEHAHMSLTSMFDVTAQVGWGGAVFRFSPKKPRRWEKLRRSAKRERRCWIAYGTMSKNASLEPWKIVIHKATLIRKIWCSMCIDGNGADLVTMTCSQVWVKPVKGCADSLRNFCPEKTLSQKCLPLWRNVQNGQFSMSLT